MLQLRSFYSISKATIACVAAFAMLAGLATPVAYAQNYPTTSYNGFGSFQSGGGDFSTSQPSPDAPPMLGVGDHTSMSPDSWGQPSTSSTESFSTNFRPTTVPADTRSLQTEYRFEKTETPNVPDLKKTVSPFSQSNYSKPSLNRYPLDGNQDTESSGANSILDPTGQIENTPNSITQNSASPFPTATYPNTSTPNTTIPNSFSPYSGPPSPFNQNAAPNGVPYSVTNAEIVNPFVPNQLPTTESAMNSGFGWNGGPNVAPNQTFVPSQQGFVNQSGMPSFRPDLGHRNSTPTIRNHGSYDSGQKYDFEEKKKEYPPFSEILATGRYFGSGSMLYLRPSFQGNTAITTLGPGFGESTPFDFDYEVAPQFRFGFESKYGPGIEMNYWQFDETSNDATFVSDGVTTGTSSTWMLGPSSWSRLTAANAGDTIVANHTIDIESFGVSFFKEVKLPISRINGIFGFQYVSVAQAMNATLSNGGTEIGRLTSRSDMRAIGPKLGFEYYRPVGHTKVEFVTAVGLGVLFGQRDQSVENTVSNDFSRVGADEFITNFDFWTGVQYKKMIAENRAYFARAGFVYQTWIGGGTAVNPQDDFGLRGFSFSVGYNR
ncbi:MAG: Lpg1974 family pore-forming outer membrane protein [Mariniblastus sp.]